MIPSYDRRGLTTRASRPWLRPRSRRGTALAIVAGLMLVPRPGRASTRTAASPTEAASDSSREDGPPSAAARSPVEDEPASPEGRGLVLAGSVLAGLSGAIALGGGIALGVLARQRSRAVEEAQTEGNPEGLTFGELQALEREGKRFEGIQVGVVAGAAVVAVTGAVLLSLGLRKRDAGRAEARARLVPSRGGLALSGRF